jgi:hypothetical protein
METSGSGGFLIYLLFILGLQICAIVVNISERLGFDKNKEYSIEEYKKISLEKEVSITLPDGRIVVGNTVYRNKEHLEKALRFAKKYFRFIDIITLKFLRK